MTDYAGTGAELRVWREEHKLSRREFAELCGFNTQTRIMNIESKESWKVGDREKVQAGLDRAAALPAKHVRHSSKAGAEKRIDQLEEKLRANGKLLREQEPDDYEIELFTGDEELATPSLVDWVFNPDLVDRAFEGLAPNGDDFDFEEGEKYLTNSEVAVWLRCRRKWWLSTYRALVANGQDYEGPRAIGNRIHRALAGWYVPDGQERRDPREVLREAIDDDWAAMEKQVRERGVQGDVDDYLATMSHRFEQATELERAVIEGYMQWLSDTAADAHLNITAPETKLTSKIVQDVNGEKIEFTALALLDVRATRVMDGVRLLMDHKSVGNFTDVRKTLHMDPQMLHYLMLEWLNTEDGEARCDAALYNMLRKVKRTGNAKPPFYERVEVHHNEIELENYRKRLVGAARDIKRATAELDAGVDPMFVAYPTPDSKKCSWDCDFFNICPMFDDGSRVEDAITALFHTGNPLARYATDKETGGMT